VVAHNFNPSTQKAEAAAFLWVRGQPGLQSEFQDSQGYTEKPCFEKTKTKNKRTHAQIKTGIVFYPFTKWDFKNLWLDFFKKLFKCFSIDQIS
jgi:hypothetical protein